MNLPLQDFLTVLHSLTGFMCDHRLHSVAGLMCDPGLRSSQGAWRFHIFH